MTRVCGTVAELAVWSWISSLSTRAPESPYAESGGNVSLKLTDGSVYLLQKWCDVWATYVDVEEIDDLEDKDKVTVVPMATSQQPSSSKVS